MCPHVSLLEDIASSNTHLISGYTHPLAYDHPHATINGQHGSVFRFKQLLVETYSQKQIVQVLHLPLTNAVAR